MKPTQKLNILILLGDDFPIGGAYTNRMIGFAKGFQEMGHEVQFFIIYPSHKYFSENYKSGVYEGVKYKIVHKFKSFPLGLIKKLIVCVLSSFYTIRGIIALNSGKKIDCILSGTDNMIFILPVFIWSKIKNVLFLREFNEYPKPEQGTKKRYPIITNLYYKTKFNLFDGLILISEPLDIFFSKILRKQKRTIIIPIIVEPERFQNQSTEIRKDIVFIGDILGDKDGVSILIDAFALFAKKVANQNLILIGEMPEGIKNDILKEKIKKLNLDERVIFLGFVPRKNVGQYLCRAKALVLARPANKQAEAGFPTKLGEYLATGNPVVCTKVSDIPKYLIDGENAYLAEPGNALSFAEKLINVFDDPVLAEKIGENGKKLTYKEFNYKYQSDRIIKFILQLKGQTKISKKKRSSV